MCWLPLLFLILNPYGNLAEDISSNGDAGSTLQEQVLTQIQELKGVVMHTNKDDYILMVIKALQKDLTHASEDIKVVQDGVTSQSEKILTIVEENQKHIQSLSEKFVAATDILQNYSKELKENSIYANVKIELLQKVCIDNFEKVDSKINELTKNVNFIHSKQEEIMKSNTNLVIHTINNTQQHSHSHLSFPLNCQDLLDNGHSIDGVHEIFPYSETMSSVPVWCDMDGTRGWTVLVVRKYQDVQVNFQHKWGSYKTGFGRPDSEYWLGLEPLYRITSKNLQVLRIEVEDWDGQVGWAEYTDFWVEAEDEKYRLHVGNYTGTIGNALKHHDMMKFSTFDQDNDNLDSGSCSNWWHGKGGFWFGICALTNPTGIFKEKQETELGISWHPWKNSWETLKKLVFKIRPQ